jgi:mono/diheme cytochrome c family protein
MARKFVRWIVAALAVLIGVIVVAVAAVYIISSARLGRTYAITPPAVTIPTDAANVERGQHLVTAHVKCVDCHGDNLGGKIFIDAPPFLIIGPNLTDGQGGIKASLRDEDWIRAVRHGVGRDGRALLFMPTEEYIHLTERDLGDIIAYVKSVPPVDNTQARSHLRPLGRVLLVAGQLPPPAAATIDHATPFPTPVPEGVTVEYGRYLATIGGCVGCHGPGLSGGRIPGVPPDFPPASNITPSGAIGQWSEADFFRVLREGKRPNGVDVNPLMPWMATAKLTDDEIRALWTFLRSVPSKPFGNR